MGILLSSEEIVSFPSKKATTPPRKLGNSHITTNQNMDRLIVFSGEISNREKRVIRVASLVPRP